MGILDFSELSSLLSFRAARRLSHGGISDALKDKIFEPFYTTKTHGTGLGLAVVQSVVKAHQGRINVENLTDEGACFSIMLPRAFASDMVIADTQPEE